jgi:hypothetical protein
MHARAQLLCDAVSVWALACHKVDAVLRVEDFFELDNVRVDTHCVPHLWRQGGCMSNTCT